MHIIPKFSFQSPLTWSLPCSCQWNVHWKTMLQCVIFFPLKSKNNLWTLVFLPALVLIQSPASCGLLHDCCQYSPLPPAWGRHRQHTVWAPKWIWVFFLIIKKNQPWANELFTSLSFSCQWYFLPGLKIWSRHNTAFACLPPFPLLLKWTHLGLNMVLTTDC